MTDEPTTAWLTRLAAGVGQRAADVVRRTTPSGAELAVVGDVVVKLHHPRTDAAELGARLGAVARRAGPAVWVQPLEALPRRAPDGRLATVWPRVEVLTEADPDLPWVAAGALLAELHRTDHASVGQLPAQGGPARVARALTRVRGLDHPAAQMLGRLGTRLLDEVATSTVRREVVHGDWHLGQLARTEDGLRLLDVDDLGTGDPAWDLGRPAGFWAAGALEDAAWEGFLGAYREAGGTAVPGDGDPWPHLDLPARCAVFVAAVRPLVVQPAHSTDPADALLEACARM
ncbi:aminoglycoside phosphotransferase family protein [Terrabacter sp. LjRoot27]|uniref:phosphotransferase family protein n=1 Tax=Terrabacter sp. LjRoot27 TaxID=3342306 RepID=UPI003ECD28E9